MMDNRCNLRFALVILLIHEVSLQSITIEAVQGDSVILLCSARGYEKDVFWRHNNTKTVYDIIEGKEDFHDQDAVFRGRVKGFPSKFTEGNYSIRLSDVIYSDAGNYSCKIPNSKTVHVELRIKGSGRNSGITTSTDWVAVFQLVCVLLFGFTL
ncbi:V-set domain-containing T-cell activation inhibitor 1-like [Silurus meridionalis]|uniref:Ig-like domain-containing protein n=1 Tax=Silurus meridionalis TaxID=175797 RepID=A0A8T0A8K5_SILME|nr:V-set domain-containing T-cell activation inhibitor 1-like [Silurus meridionalis]KAF7688323.1 hypothetical protein HF521_014329 [Silurus meridionalis]